jgi:hypothetical protein
VAVVRQLSFSGIGTFAAMQTMVPLLRVDAHAISGAWNGKRGPTPLTLHRNSVEPKRIHKGDLVDGCTCRDVHRQGWSNLSEPEQVQSGLDLLVDCDLLASETH